MFLAALELREAPRKYASYEACSRELRSEVGGDLEPSECPRGIDAKELDNCMEAIRGESCRNPVETLSRLAACRTRAMCLETDIKNR